MSEDHRSIRGSLAKIAVNLSPSDWHSHALETLWAEPLGEDRYRVQNVPFYAYDLSFDDTVIARPIGGQTIIQQVIERAGHSTYRIFLSRGITTADDAFATYWTPLEAIGVTYEQANDRLLSIDVPAETNIFRAYELLQAAEKAGVWDFEEAHCGHPVNG